MPTPSIQTLVTDAQQILNLDSISAVRSVVAVALANANTGTPLNPNLTTQQLWNEFYQVVNKPKSDIESIIANQLMKFLFAPPAPGGVGADKQVIFNDGGVLAGDPQFLWNKTTNLLTVTGSATITGDLTVDTSTLKVDTSNNRVGIGTATPASRLDVTDAATPVILSLTLTGAQRWQQIIDTTLGDFTLRDQTGAINVLTAKAGTGNVNIVTGNVVMATSGKGIDFSATANSSGTMTSELLNDYEEGTWTIGIAFGGASTGITYSQNTGKYTKVGRLVTVFGAVDLTNKGSATGNASITGLPFSIGGASSDYSAASLQLVNITFANFPMGFGNPATTTIPLQEVTNAGVRTNLTDADFANNSAIIFSLTYSV